jgi:hypothetical protein
MSTRRTLTAGLALGAATLAARARYLRWGATDQEVNLVLPGDELVAEADLVATRAISVYSSAEQVWPWIAQLGQGRGGFYSYDFAENLVGCDIHSAERIVPEWQSIEVGDEVKLQAELPLAVVRVDRGRLLLLRGAVPIGSAPAPYDFTWAFALIDGDDGTTRLVVRERYGYSRPWARLIVEPVELISFVMSRRMLQGIKRRVEHAAVTAVPAC